MCPSMDQHVLTAAHCFGSIKYVSIGSHYLSGSRDGERIQVVKQTRHPQYNGNTNSNDFLILELAKEATKATPVALSSGAPAVGTTATTAGWGTTSSGGSQSNVLLAVNVPVVDQATCAKVLKVDGTMLCAGGRANQDSCQGDSGGPLTAQVSGREALIGVVSWGNGCGLAGYPGVYARVSTAKGWIDSALGSSYKATWV
ncbi:hypothetical protein ATCC90586_005145 [Pythium insidiosum]|nr:hypothetical protein ATCC90586_005145 [Pythium insidiosum]